MDDPHLHDDVRQGQQELMFLAAEAKEVIILNAVTDETTEPSLNDQLNWSVVVERESNLHKHSAVGNSCDLHTCTQTTSNS